MPLWLWLKSHYATLGVDPTDSSEVIKKAHRAKSLEHHPDRNPQRAERAGWWFKQVQAAWEVLSDPSARAAHDSALHAELEKRVADEAALARSIALATAPQFIPAAVRAPGFGEVAANILGSVGAMWVTERLTERMTSTPAVQRPVPRTPPGRRRR